MARIFLDEMGGINQGGILASYGLPMSPFSTEEYAPTIVETPSRPTRTRRKRSKPKPKRNDGIIRNHDSVWDYKIQDGKLLTRRKTSDGRWYDITSNDEARQRIEQFTGRSISNKQSASNNSFQTSKPTNTTKLSNSSQSQSSKPASTAQTQQTARPAATQPTRQQIARQDSTRRNTTAIPQSRSLATTRGSNTELDWQNMTDDEVQAWFNTYSHGLPEITVEAKGNPNKNKNQLLKQEDLDANGWKWSDKVRGINDYGPLFEDAYNRTQQGEKILTDIEGRIIPKSEVNRYINRGRIPLYLSDYDAQFYQPQSEAGTIADIRRAQDARRNRDFDNQRNIGLAAMFGAPILAGSLATAPAATLLALGGSELVGAGFEGAWKRGTGKSWAESLGGNDPNAQFYANMIQPGRIIGGTLGAGVANATQPARQAIIDAISARLPKPNVRGARLSLAMNKALNNKKLNAQDKRILKESVPYLFEPSRKTPTSITYPLNYGNYNYMNSALETMTAGPYAIPNYTNGVPFGVPIPKNIWGEMQWLPADPLNRGSRVPYLNVP